jgi:hypothetical protein
MGETQNEAGAGRFVAGTTGTNVNVLSIEGCQHNNLAFVTIVCSMCR